MDRNVTPQGTFDILDDVLDVDWKPNEILEQTFGLGNSCGNSAGCGGSCSGNSGGKQSDS